MGRFTGLLFLLSSVVCAGQSTGILERPNYLIEKMASGELKTELTSCMQGLAELSQNSFTIGHRGAARNFAEHTLESYQAAAAQGAGLIECDVTFTKDLQLVCRHSQCDLHRTTNILATPLAQNCSLPFKGANQDQKTSASAKCCTSDITLAEFKSLCGRMDYVNNEAQSVIEYLAAIPPWLNRELSECPTVLSHRESIVEIDRLGVNFTPELKTPQVDMPFQGHFSQEQFAAKMFSEYRQHNIAPERVWPQSFEFSDIENWLIQYPEYRHHMVFLDDRKSADSNFVATEANMQSLYDQGVRIVAPNIWTLLDFDPSQGLVASHYAKLARSAGLQIITWTFDSPHIPKGNNGKPLFTDGDRYKILDVLAQDVGVIGVFSDWSASVSFYANCKM